jgi:hypothetical protein
MQKRLLVIALVLVAGVLSAQSPYTHYVTPDGVSSVCTEIAPCSLRMSSQFPFPAGSVVRVATGEYSTAQLTFGRSGTAAAPIRFSFAAGARLSGTRDKPATWAPTEGHPHVFETTDCGLTTCGLVGTVAQRSPATWRPIRVDDRLPPFTVSLGRPIDLEIPPPFKPVYSLADVEAQHGTFMTTAARVYVHSYHDGQPTPEDDLYVAPAHWGSVRIEGDFLEFDGLTIEKTSGTGLHVRPSANRTVLRRLTARAAQVWLEGWNTIAEDIDVSHVIKQGPPNDPHAYDANPDFGIGENWQGHAKGDALLIGRQGVQGGRQTVRRARVHRSWNGVRVDGHNTLEGSWLWGFPNHSMQASGSGVIIRDNVVAAGQDSLYLEGTFFDHLTVEHNAFVNALLVWASRDGQPIGTAPTSWTLRGNILPAIVLDDRTVTAMTAGCNAYVPKSSYPSHVVKVTNTAGGFDVTYRSLAAAQAAELEPESIELPFTFWTDGGALRNFVNQTDPTSDMGEPLTVCGERVGPRSATN